MLFPFSLNRRKLRLETRKKISDSKKDSLLTKINDICNHIKHNHNSRTNSTKVEKSDNLAKYIRGHLNLCKSDRLLTEAKSFLDEISRDVYI